MKKTDKDGNMLEGTPAELAEYEKLKNPPKLPAPLDEKVMDDLVRAFEKVPNQDFQPWTIPIFPNPTVPSLDRFIWTKQDWEECSIIRYFKDNPGAQSVAMVCYCKRCSPWSMATAGSTLGAGLSTTGVTTTKVG